MVHRLRLWLEKRLLNLWYQEAPPPFFLKPLAWLYGSIMEIRHHWLIRQRDIPSVPVILVGNLSLGGTGKTMVVIALTRFLKGQGEKVIVISRGYGRCATGLKSSRHLASLNASDLGDEPLLIAKETGCEVIVSRRRIEALSEAVSQGATLVIADDGLQHQRLHRDLSICCIDGQRGLGNGECLPAGPLREFSSRMRDMDYVLVKGSALSSSRKRTQTILDSMMQNKKASLSVGAPVFSASLCTRGIRRLTHPEEILPLTALPEGRGLVIAGLGYPEGFFQTVAESYAGQREWVSQAFPDHFAFSASDIQDADYEWVLMSEKDAIKCSSFAKEKWFSLSAEIVLASEFTHNILNDIQRIRSLRGQ